MNSFDTGANNVKSVASFPHVAESALGGGVTSYAKAMPGR